MCRHDIAQRRGLFLKCREVMPLAKMMFISEIIQLNEAAHERDYRAMGIAWAASERQKSSFMNIKRGNGVKKELLAEKYSYDKRNTTVKSFENVKNREWSDTVII
jgi:hypothetical protein